MRAVQLVKRYGTVTAVGGIDLTVSPATCVGIVGRNGAGKSTTLRMLTTVSRPTSGELSVFGLDPLRHSTAIKRRIGVVPQTNTLDDELTVRQNLEIYSRYFGMSRREARGAAERALKLARLPEKANNEVSTLSGGMKRRLTIARSLVNNPDLLLMDEPTAALDAQSKHAIWSTLTELRSAGKTIILMSHDMEEVQALADLVLIMDSGRFTAEGSPAELIATHCRSTRLDIVIERPDTVDWHTVLQGAEAVVNPAPRGVVIEVADGQRGMDLLRASSVNFTAATVRPTTLEDVFLHVTGRRAD